MLPKVREHFRRVTKSKEKLSRVIKTFPKVKKICQRFIFRIFAEQKNFQTKLKEF